MVKPAAIHLIRKLRPPRLSELARKRKIVTKPPRGKHRNRGSQTLTVFPFLSPEELTSLKAVLPNFLAQANRINPQILNGGNIILPIHSGLLLSRTF